MLIQVGENEILTAMPPAFGTLPTPEVSAWPSSRGDTEYTSGRHLSLPAVRISRRHRAPGDFLQSGDRYRNRSRPVGLRPLLSHAQLAHPGSVKDQPK
jgi:hypothetical protein